MSDQFHFYITKEDEMLAGANAKKLIEHCMGLGWNEKDSALAALAMTKAFGLEVEPSANAVGRLTEELAAVKKDHADDWKRIQDAERALEAVKSERDELKSKMNHERYALLVDQVAAQRDQWREAAEGLAEAGECILKQFMFEGASLERMRIALKAYNEFKKSQEERGK